MGRQPACRRGHRDARGAAPVRWAGPAVIAGLVGVWAVLWFAAAPPGQPAVAYLGQFLCRVPGAVPLVDDERPRNAGFAIEDVVVPACAAVARGAARHRVDYDVSIRVEDVEPRHFLGGTPGSVCF